MKTIAVWLALASAVVGCGGTLDDKPAGPPLRMCCAPIADSDAIGACSVKYLALCREGIDPAQGKASWPSADAPGADGTYVCVPTDWCTNDGPARPPVR